MRLGAEESGTKKLLLFFVCVKSIVSAKHKQTTRLSVQDLKPERLQKYVKGLFVATFLHLRYSHQCSHWDNKVGFGLILFM